MTMASYAAPSEIAFGQPLHLFVEATSNDEEDVCGGDLSISVTHQGAVLDGPKAESIEDDESTQLSLKVPGAGQYDLVVTGTYLTYDNTYDCTVSTPLESTIPLFTLTKSGPGPISTAPVRMSSSGGHTIVAHAYWRSANLHITYRIADPAKRSNLLYTMCYWEEEWESGMSKGDDIHDISEDDCSFRADV
jgi:hypothetical protein